MRTLIDYDYDMKNCKTHWYISVLNTFENIKNPIIIVLSSYFHILEAKVWHLFSCTCIFLNVRKCILKHAIIQYYAMKAKLLIIKIKNNHEFNVLNLHLWILSTQKKQ
jgi:hypothetical protein